MTNSRVLISGAGVAGPALAYWLVRRGFEVTVVERSPELRVAGYKVDVRGAATEVLRKMGLLEAAQAADTGMRRITYVNKDGRPIAALPADLLMGRRGDDLEIMRWDLSRLIYEATKDDVEYVFGDAIASIDDGDVTFEKGAPRRFDHVVGADGLHSATRRMSMGEVPLRHLGAYISIFNVPNTLGIEREEVMYFRPERLAFAYAMGPDSPARVGLTFASPEMKVERDPKAQKAILREAFAGMGWRVDEFLDAMDRTDLNGDGEFYFDSMSQVELPSWSKGRVVLLGDAAHCPAPASGQGSSLALVGAYVLGRHLGEPGGLTEYERRMRPYVEKNIAFGRKMAKDMVPGGRLSIAFRSYGMRTLKYHPRKEQVIDKFLAPMLDAANAIEL